MIKLNISRIIPFFFLTRQISMLQQVPKRKLITTLPLLKENKNQNSPKLEKKTENKKDTFQEAKKKVYYKFLCKCEAGFNSFPEFLNHVKTFHKIKSVNFQEILAKKNGFKRGIKFY